MPEPEVSASFVRVVKNALQNLYDPEALRKNPLMKLLDLDPSTGAAPLRQLLITTIESLKPDASIPRDARPWRVYWILFYLYVSQFSRPMVANNLALSVRQVIREEKHAIQVMADELWSRYNIAAKMGNLPSPRDAAVASGPSREDELFWLEKSLPRDTVDIGQLIARATETIQPLLDRYGVRLKTRIANGLPYLLAPSAMLYQAILNSLTAVVCAVPGGEVTISAETEGRRLYLRIEPVAVIPVHLQVSMDKNESLGMARQLLQTLDGSLEVHHREKDSSRPFNVLLSLPLADHVPVLVVDDNPDALQLFQRYLAGTRYLFIGTRDPLEALHLAETRKPHVILLDVMLPAMDGWQVLQRLMHSPPTQKTPIIVCTILPEEQLALAMGAAYFLRKPISQSDLLAALDQVCAETFPA